MRALDLFAGTGWGVACQRLGIEEYGVEIMPAAIATREANGMTTIYRDVWEGLTDPAVVPDHDILIASPPCQTFSMAGSGTGRRALDDVLALIESKVHEHPDELQALTELSGFDDRTALVLTPLAYAMQWQPPHIAWEQVPTVLPVWEACADALRAIGYSVETGIVHSEQHGVPQTRKRAYLVARNDGHEAAFPTATHSRYYSHQPAKLDAGVQKWVSMAEALGRHSIGSVLRSNYSTGSKLGRAMAKKGSARPRTTRSVDEPSLTITSKAGSADWVLGDHVEALTITDASLLQSFPAGFTFEGTRGEAFMQAGNAVPPLMALAVLSAVTTGQARAGINWSEVAA